MTTRLYSRLPTYVAASCLMLLLTACGMKGPLQPAASPPPADPALMAPPTLPPDTPL
ncbi:LPS translocon maturation chaperone LptM [Castellaniella sp.]|uniref:LPS translocon maturation chaperone LptM n=1 Tax=Castellaniella sp. TaxID=1955812 RepID=UPI003A4C6DC1